MLKLFVLCWNCLSYVEIDCPMLKFFVPCLSHVFCCWHFVLNIFKYCCFSRASKSPLPCNFSQFQFVNTKRRLGNQENDDDKEEEQLENEERNQGLHPRRSIVTLFCKQPMEILRSSRAQPESITKLKWPTIDPFYLAAKQNILWHVVSWCKWTRAKQRKWLHCGTCEKWRGQLESVCPMLKSVGNHHLPSCRLSYVCRKLSNVFLNIGQIVLCFSQHRTNCPMFVAT